MKALITIVKSLVRQCVEDVVLTTLTPELNKATEIIFDVPFKGFLLVRKYPDGYKVNWLNDQELTDYHMSGWINKSFEKELYPNLLTLLSEEVGLGIKFSKIAFER